MEDQVKAKSEEADKQIAILDARFSALTETFTTARAYVATQVYAIEHTSLSGKASLQKSLAKYEAGPFELALPSLPDGEPRERHLHLPAIAGRVQPASSSTKRKCWKRSRRCCGRFPSCARSAIPT